jgi:hypothetical protein
LDRVCVVCGGSDGAVTALQLARRIDWAIGMLFISIDLFLNSKAENAQKEVLVGEAF